MPGSCILKTFPTYINLTMGPDPPKLVRDRASNDIYNSSRCVLSIEYIYCLSLLICLVECLPDKIGLNPVQELQFYMYKLHTTVLGRWYGCTNGFEVILRSGFKQRTDHE